MAPVRQPDVCSDHRQEWLEGAEPEAVAAAATCIKLGADVPAEVAAVLLSAIDRMEHELGHAHWGGLECDRGQGDGPRTAGRPGPGRAPGVV